jgi:hypothetical protein
MKQNTNNHDLVNKFKSLRNTCQKYDQMASKLNADTEIINKKILRDIINESDQLEEQINNTQKDFRKLSIGIIGQVKAGKSSFLNSLVFEGKNILPKAATPMTAALTILTYAEKNKAIIHFYNHDDWENITNLHLVYQSEKDKIINLEKNKNQPFKLDEIESKISEELRAANDIYKMGENIPNLNKLIAQNSKIIEVDEIEQLIDKLNDYVGAGGTYTALTKYVELELNIESLKDIEIVDTPGVNDPIISRGIITEKYLKKCDIAFLLSYCGQFMGKADSIFLLDALPNEGISTISIIGSKLDSALRDKVAEGIKNTNLQKVIKELKSILIEQAEKILLPILKDKQQIPTYKKILDHFKIHLISSLSYNMAFKKEDQWNEDEKLFFNFIKEKFPDFSDINKSFLIELSNIESVKSHIFNDVRADKEIILRDKLNDILNSKLNLYKEIKSKIINDLSMKIEELKTEDLQSLRVKADTLSNNLENSRDQIEDIFNTVIEDVDSSISKKHKELKAESRKFDKVNIESSEHEYEVSTSKWWNPFSWGSTKTCHETVYYAKIRPVVNQIEEYIDKINNEIEFVWKSQKDKIKKNSIFYKELIKSIENVSDLSNDAFDSNVLKRSVRNVIENIQIPEISLNPETYSDNIIKFFGISRVQGDSDIEKLENEVGFAIKNAVQDMSEQLKESKNKFKEILNNQSNKFIENIKHDVDQNIQNIQKQIKNKEEFIDIYQNALKDIELNKSN